MRKIRFLLFLLFAGVLASYSQSGFWMKSIEKRLEKGAAPNSGPTPDYSKLSFWAASPHKHDTADSIPIFLKNERKEEKADVFYIYPTTYIGKEQNLSDSSFKAKEIFKLVQELPKLSWNADLNDEALNHQTDVRPLLFQATAFNGSCRVFAPRYRQANIKAFLVHDSPEAKQAFDLAYSDIKSAFEYYLKHENNSRPIVIASHSQGSLHAIRLLKDFFDGKPLQKQLVCAYIIGYRIPKGTFKSIPLGNFPTSTGCFVTWRTFEKGEIPSSVKKENGDSQCVNPLTWKTEADWASEKLNQGALLDFNKILPNFTGAGIEPESKILWVKMPDHFENKYKKIKNYHVLDYNLFWMNIRENVKERIDAYLSF